MPNRFPIANGNWSNPEIWSGSIIPTASDDVYANNRIVILDQNIDVLRLSAANTTGISASGYFIATDGISIKANIIGSTSPLTTYSVFPLSLTNGVTSINPTLLITGSMNVSLTGSAFQTGIASCIPIVHMGTGTLNMSGSTFDVSSAPGGQYNQGMILLYTGSLNIIGNLTTAITTGTPGLWNWYGRVNVVGNLQARVNQGTTTIYSTCIRNEYGIINITGNITATSINNAAYGAHGIDNLAGVVNIVGNLNSSASNVPCVANTSNLGVIYHTGIVTAGTTAPALSNGTTTGIISCIGQIIASTTSVGYQSTSTTATNVLSGPFINSGSRNAIYCYNVQMYKNATTSYRIGVSGSNDTITLLTNDQSPGMPVAANVRSGVIYGPTNALIGTMAVPDPRSVSIGVAVDNAPTVGVAMTTAADLWNYAVTAMTASNSVGQRLANVATSASTTATANAFG